MGRARRPRDGYEVIERHIERSHPNCPAELKARFVEEIAGRAWTRDVTVGAAFGIVATNYVRHELTDYERLLRVRGLTREECRIIVREQVKDIVESWAPLKQATGIGDGK